MVSIEEIKKMDHKTKIRIGLVMGIFCALYWGVWYVPGYAVWNMDILTQLTPNIEADGFGYDFSYLTTCLFLTGFSWPEHSFPAFWKYFSWLFPSTFAVRAFMNMNTAGAGLAMAEPQLTALTIQIIVYYILSCIAAAVENRILKKDTDTQYSTLSGFAAHSWNAV